MNHLKQIADMTVEEMKAEIRSSRFQSNDKYIFVSYSHVDCAIVYPVVLGWIRDGYNVYIDLDFVNHGSDENWVTKMNERIEDNGCALVAVFQSKNSAFSYAALLELLTVRSETTTSLHAKKVPVDIFKIENLDDDPSLDNLGEEKKQAYINAFEMLSNNMGESLCKNNKQERELLEDGIISWFDQKGKELAYKSADMILELLDKAYKRGPNTFYPFIARLTKDWLRTFDLNGNTKSLTDPVEERFTSLKIKKTSSAAAPVREETIAPIGQISEETSAPVSIPVEQPAVVPQPVEEIKEPAASVVEEGYPRYFKRDDKRVGFLKQTGEKEFWILPGAEMRKESNPSCQSGYIKRRQKIVEQGQVVDRGEFYEICEELIFDSLSAAAAVLKGNNMRGTTFWLPCERAETGAVPEKETPETADASVSAAPALEVYRRSDGRPGRLRKLGDKEYVICAGSVMRKAAAQSCPYIAAREEIKAAGILREEGDDYVFVCDYTVKSTSAAASILSGVSKSGTIFWEPDTEQKTDPVAANDGDSTVGHVRRLFAEDEAFCRAVGELRKGGLPYGGRGAMDFLMAALLGGCNKVKSPAQINYYAFAVADASKKKGEGLGNTWSWASNCASFMGTGRQLDETRESFFAAVDPNTTLAYIRSALQTGDAPFNTKNNELVIKCLDAFVALL